jgi:undecaprenyl diphosphate synthase
MVEEKIPKHVAIIPDGNRRWAKEKGLKAFEGHARSATSEHLSRLFNEAEKLGVEYLSFWGFSTENWNRGKIEIKILFDLLRKNVEGFKKDVEVRGIKFRILGRRDRLPGDLVKGYEEIENDSKDNKGLNVQLLLDYGGRDEILRAVNKLPRGDISEYDFGKALDSLGIPDVDLIIRTSGEKRLSGFMLWQGIYAELYFEEKNFPDFYEADLRKAIEDFGKRKRRFGGD